MDCTSCVDQWLWVACYRDGTRLYECNGTGHHVFADIDLDALESLTWVPRIPGQLPRLSVRIDEPGMRPILFRRRLIELSLSGAEAGRQTIHCLGWKKTGVESFTFMFADGSLVTSSNRNAV